MSHIKKQEESSSKFSLVPHQCNHCVICMADRDQQKICLAGSAIIRFIHVLFSLWIIASYSAKSAELPTYLALVLTLVCMWQKADAHTYELANANTYVGNCTWILSEYETLEMSIKSAFFPQHCSAPVSINLNILRKAVKQQVPPKINLCITTELLKTAVVQLLPTRK